MSKLTTVSISEIRRDGGTQPRGMIDMITVQQYADEIRDGADFPPVTLFYDGSTYWLADGFHRTKAHEEANKAEITATVHQGTQRDAVLHSLGANSTHGLRRSNADKQRAIRRLLLDPEWTVWSDRRIGQVVRCSHKTVGAARRRLEQNGEIPAINTRKTAGGRTIDTSAIGNNQAQETPPQPRLRIEEESTGEFPSQPEEEVAEEERIAMVLVEDETPALDENAIRQELLRHIDSSGRFVFQGATTDFLQGIAEEFNASYQTVSNLWFQIRFPMNQSAHQPVNPPVHQPVSPPVHQPTSPPAHQPTSPPAHQPTSPSTKINLLDTLSAEPESDLNEEEKAETIAIAGLDEETKEEPREKINLLDTLVSAKPYKGKGNENLDLAVRIKNRDAGTNASVFINLKTEGGKLLSLKKTTVSNLFSVLLTTLNPYLPEEE